MVHNLQLLKRFPIIFLILLVIKNKYRIFCLRKKISVIISWIKYKTWHCNSSIMTSLPFVVFSCNLQNKVLYNIDILLMILTQSSNLRKWSFQQWRNYFVINSKSIFDRYRLISRYLLGKVFKHNRTVCFICSHGNKIVSTK